MKLLILIFSLLSFCFSCGVKGPPLPPVDITAQPKNITSQSSKTQKTTEVKKKTETQHKKTTP